MSNERRRNTFNMQGQPARHFILMQAILLIILMVHLLYVIFSTLNQGFESLPANEQVELGSFFDQISEKLLFKISAVFVVVMVLNFLIGLIYLQRLTGPMTRIQGVLNQIASGEIPAEDTHVRKRDYGKDVIHALNEALRRLRTWRK